MNKICIIGGSGFVGTRLIELLMHGFEIINLDKSQSTVYPQLTTIGDVRDKDFLIRCLKGLDLVILLAAEHRDDVSPTSLYYDVNVQGTQNVLDAMDVNGIKNIIFTSSVAIYGLNKDNPNEQHLQDPFNHYGKSKWQAEEILRKWHHNDTTKNLQIIRPTVIFGEKNRGNVYNLLKAIASGNFRMVGKGTNKKSMAYVGNIVEFIKFLITQKQPNYSVYNYIDKPDMNMNELVQTVSKTLDKPLSTKRLPYGLGMFAGYCFDILAFITRKRLTISSVRIKKFCATTQFDSAKIQQTAFLPPYTLEEGLSRTIQYEFIEQHENEPTFEGGG